jgi:hypothetical protein
MLGEFFFKRWGEEVAFVAWIMFHQVPCFLPGSFQETG